MFQARFHVNARFVPAAQACDDERVAEGVQRRSAAAVTRRDVEACRDCAESRTTIYTTIGGLVAIRKMPRYERLPERSPMACVHA